MVKQMPRHPLSFSGTIGNLCFYFYRGENLVRTKSSLTGKRVKKDKKFTETMKNARLLGKASAIGSEIYAALPPSWRQHWMYRAFTGEAFMLLRKGKSELEIKTELLNIYVSPVLSNRSTRLSSKTSKAIARRVHRHSNKRSFYYKNIPGACEPLEITIDNTSFRIFNYASTG